MKTVGTFLILLFFSPSVFSQADTLLIQNAPQNILFKLGRNALYQGDPNSAITFFEAYLNKDKKNAKAYYFAGQAEWETRNYEKAQKYFLTAYKTDKKKSKDALFYHALALKSNGKYDSAKHQFETFRQEYHGKNKLLKKISAHEVAYCDSVSKLMKKDDKIKITHLDSSVNKVNIEAAPVALDENTMIFSSLRTGKKEYYPEDEPEKAMKKKVFFAKKESTKGGDVWKFQGEYGNEINSNEYHVGSAAFSPDHKRMYFSRCKPNESGEMRCAIYVSEKKGEYWSVPEKLPKTINKKRCSNTMPAVASDPVKGSDIVYFVSNRGGGKGGLDIWYSVYDKKTKTFKPAKNAGSKINTTQNEMSPFFDNETRSLYFSSDGHPGLGGYDIFKAVGDGKKFASVNNMAEPFNSGADDIYFSIGTKRDEGFFVSNRKGGYGLKHATCCDDIYSYKYKEYIFIKLKGQVGDVLEEHNPVSNATIEIYTKDPVTGEKFLKKTVQTDSLGKYETPLEANEDYYMVVKQKDFLGKSEDISTKGMKASQVLEKKFEMVKKPHGSVTIPNINYEFDRADLDEVSKKIIDSVVINLLVLNPELMIEIQSHTDSKGSDAANLKLSQRRAESVVNYLVSKHISAKRLRAKGYGESKPIAPNQNADGSDNPEGRHRNRRTDFKIIGTLDLEIIYDSGH